MKKRAYVNNEKLSQLLKEMKENDTPMSDVRLVLAVNKVNVYIHSAETHVSRPPPLFSRPEILINNDQRHG